MDTLYCTSQKSRYMSLAKTQKTPLAIMPPLFGKENYIWMMVGGLVIALGMLLMSGGKNQDPNVFDYKVVYSFTRITVAPIMILAGLIIEMYAIFKKSKPTV